MANSTIYGIYKTKVNAIIYARDIIKSKLHYRRGSMKDYIKDGLSKHLAPPVIYDNICKALENPQLTEDERKELLKQKEKANDIAMKMKDIFRFPSI